MAYPFPAPRKRRPSAALFALGSVALAAVACLVGVIAVATSSHPAPARPAPAPAAADVNPFDRAGFDNYWTGNASDAVQAAVTSVDWSGVVLTAHTQLVAGPAAVAPATAICAALSGYWLTTGQPFQAVRVVDGADQVLVSRHTEAEACAYRR